MYYLFYLNGFFPYKAVNCLNCNYWNDNERRFKIPNKPSISMSRLHSIQILTDDSILHIYNNSFQLMAQYSRMYAYTGGVCALWFQYFCYRYWMDNGQSKSIFFFKLIVFETFYPALNNKKILTKMWIKFWFVFMALEIRNDHRNRFVFFSSMDIGSIRKPKLKNGSECLFLFNERIRVINEKA